ncbi:hypothetical protein JXA63_02390 [Candidatus Woesebacteria bacterium]|nr:hypothetical protein [Candidatus Woesebacteria bacterium]
MSKKKSDAPVVRKDLDDAVETILKGMDNMFKDPENPMNVRLDKVEVRLGKVEGRLETVKGEIQVLKRTVKDEARGLRAELSDTVSKKEHNELKARVDRYHPAN